MTFPFFGTGENSHQSFSEIFKKVWGRKAKSTKRLTTALPGELCYQFSLDELKAATHNFHESLRLGEGASGIVYKGFIDDGALTIAVKRMKPNNFGGGSSQFLTEVQLLSQLRHQHLVSLIGFCNEGDERILVHEYMKYGTLRDYLQGLERDPLPWKQRLLICKGAAQGLHYLHTGAKYAVIHRDIKSSHILLDETWTARLSDFGLSKMGSLSLSKSLKRLDSRVVGTLGLLAPEYVTHGELTEKVDVYLFGIMLFEVICAKPLSRLWQEDFVDGLVPGEYFKYINSTGSIYRIIDPYLKGKISPECLRKFMEIAYSCIHTKASERPSMGEVEVTLAVVLELQEKADSVMEAVNPNGGLVYEEVPFCLSIGENDELPYKSQSLTVAPIGITSQSKRHHFSNKH